MIMLIVAQAAQYTGFLGFYFTLVPTDSSRPQWHWFVILVGFIIFLCLAAVEVKDYRSKAPKIFRSNRKINDFMHQWISSSGRVAIFSRDMSWAHEERFKELLKRKAENNELTICVECDINLTNELKQAGARVVTYGAYGLVPRSRFTIVDFERDGASVAVGVKQQGYHVIQTYSSGHHPFFAVSEDMVKLIARLSENDQNASPG